MTHPYRTPSPAPGNAPSQCERCRTDALVGWATVLSVMAATAALLMSTNFVLQMISIIWLAINVVDGWSPIEEIEKSMSKRIKHTCEDQATTQEHHG